MPTLLLIKITATSTIVLILSIISEHISTRAAGFLSGLPLGAAIVLFFVGLEQGPQFAANAALAMVLGLTASLAFLYTYWFVSSRFYPGTGVGGLIGTSCLSISAFFTAAYLLSYLPQQPWLMVAATILACTCSIYLFRTIPNTKIQSRVKLTFSILVIRAAVAALIVLLITGFAGSVGSFWSGLLAGFPITIFPLLLIIHKTYAANQAWPIIKNFPFGMGSLIIYGVCVSVFYPLYRIGIGTMVSMLIAGAYMIVIARWYYQRAQRG